MKTLNKEAKKQLQFKKITGVRYLNDKELNDLDWYSSSVVLELDNGIYFFPSCDDEGNNAGSLHTNDAENYIIPTIPPTDAMRKNWSSIASKQFLNSTIINVRYLNDKEVNDLGWTDTGIVCFLDNKNYFFVSADDEGNGAGSLFFSNNDILPTINL